MKIIISILLFTITLFSSDIEHTYKQLNLEIDKISPSLTTEDKVSLYYLILVTHDTITTSLYLNKKKLNSIENIKAKTLYQLSTLQKNNQHLTRNQIIKIKTLYTKMTTDAKEIIKLAMFKKQAIKIVYRDNNTNKNPYITSIIIAFILVLILIIIFLIYLLFKSKNHTTIEELPLVHELEKHNQELSEKLAGIKSIEKLNENNIIKEESELKIENNSLIHKNMELTQKIKSLNLNLKTSNDENKKLKIEQKIELQNLNEFVDSLQNELAKYECSPNNTKEKK